MFSIFKKLSPKKIFLREKFKNKERAELFKFAAQSF